ncbi:TRAP transporter small permease subunit [Stutzerimonas stutzeri]
MWAVINRLEQLVETLGSLARACLLLLVLLVSANVLIRYGFDISPVALQELEWFLISPIAMLGISYVLKHRADVRVDFIYERFQARTRAAVDLFSALATCLIGAFLAWACWHYMMQSYRIGEGSPDPGGLPHRYLIKAFLPLGFALFGLQGIADSLRALRALVMTSPNPVETQS